DVEGGIPDECALWREPERLEMRDLALIALLDRDVFAVGRREIDGRNRRGNVERNVVLFGQHGDGVGADLVRHVAIGGDAIGADDDEIDLTVAHQRACHAVGDDRRLYAVAYELPRGQACPLKEWTGFVREDADVLAAFDG